MNQPHNQDAADKKIDELVSFVRAEFMLGDPEAAEAKLKAALNTLLVEAKIEELESFIIRYKGMAQPTGLFEIRLAELSVELNKETN